MRNQDTDVGNPAESTPAPAQTDSKATATENPGKPVEIGGPTGPEPTRYGDWERKGRCYDF